MKVQVIGRVFGKDGKLIPVGTELERKSADGVIYKELKLEVATPKKPARKTQTNKAPE